MRLDNSLDKPIFKIADFGISRATPESLDNTTIGRRGTPFYRAPEVWRGEYGRESDIWGVGCIMLFLIFGQVKLEEWGTRMLAMLRQKQFEVWKHERLPMLPKPPELPDRYEFLRLLLASTLEVPRR